MSQLGSPLNDNSQIMNSSKSYNSRYRRLRGGFHHPITPSSLNSRRWRGGADPLPLPSAPASWRGGADPLPPPAASRRRRRRGGNSPLQPASLNSRRRRRRGGGSRKYRR